MRGSDFVQYIWRLPPGPQRNQSICDAITGGAFVTRALVRVPIGNRGYFEVCDDYVSIGTYDDFVRVPMDAPTAQRVADHLGFLLPTPKMVDMIWQAATVKLEPAPMPPDPKLMMGVPYFARHNEIIELARQKRVGLIAGIKKDVVVTNRLLAQPGRVAICGWHHTNGKPIQPLSLIHEASYSDYSHGVRLVYPVVRLDGSDRPLEEALMDYETAGLLCYSNAVPSEVPLRVTRFTSAAHAPSPSRPSIHDVEKTPPTGQRIVQNIPAPGGDIEGIQLVQAKNYKAGRIQPIGLVVIHDMEAPEAATTAESVAKFFATQDAGNGSSAHYCVDSDSIVQCVLEKDTAWHAPGANANGIGVEHAGYARQSAAEWMDPYSISMLELSAKLIAGICQRHGIPVRFVDDAGLLAGESGITTHAAVSLAFKKSDHTDPGPNFPMDWFLERVRQYFEIVDDPYIS